MSLRFSVSVLAMLGLMACGGGGGTLGGGPDLSAGPGSYADLDIEVDRFASYVGNPDSTVFPDASIEFDGVLLMGTDLATAIVDGDGTDPDGYLGQVNLTADLTVATGFGVTGTASNFYNTSIDAG
ncbi:MAG: hypothetical protein HKP37_04285, partial [Boseongicola sp.]|nr:hypothetical protein [Boseongicola sp.]